MEFNYLLQHPFVFICSGGTQSGKSTLISEIIARRNEIITPKIEKIIYCYTEAQPELFRYLSDCAEGIEFHRGMDVDIPEGNSTPTLVILDDFMEELSTSKQGTLFTRGSHHRSVSVIVTLQNFFYKGCRTMTLNAKYVTIAKNPRDSTIINTLGREMNCGKKSQLIELAYRDATRKSGHTYLFIDLSQDQNNEYRLRSNVFPDKNCIIYTSK